MKARTILLVLVVVGYGLFLLWPLLTNPREKQARQRIEFLEIGRKIKAYTISESNSTPRSLEELYTNGVLSAQDMQFVQSHHVAYLPAFSTSSVERVLLIMPVGSGVLYRYHLDGNVTRGRGGTN